MRCFWTATVALVTLYGVSRALGQETTKTFTYTKTKQSGNCWMPNHFHLVLCPRGDGDLSTWMQWLRSSGLQSQ